MILQSEGQIFNWREKTHFEWRGTYFKLIAINLQSAVPAIKINFIVITVVMQFSF